jgi:hypothetical protein
MINETDDKFITDYISSISSVIIDQLYTVTLDNTSNNTTTCEVIEEIHARRKYTPWKAEVNQLP